MTRAETKQIVDKIQVYRQSFLITNNVYQEWFRVLELYDYEDVDKKLDEFFQNGDNFGRYPDVYYLTKYLKKQDEKLKSDITYVRCQNCQRIIEFNKYGEHFDRCSSIEYISKMSNLVYKKALNKNKLFDLNNNDFEQKYWQFCNQVINKLDEGQEKYNLKNSILLHNGSKPKLEIQKLDFFKGLKNDRKSRFI